MKRKALLITLTSILIALWVGAFFILEITANNSGIGCKQPRQIEKGDMEWEGHYEYILVDTCFDVSDITVGKKVAYARENSSGILGIIDAYLGAPGGPRSIQTFIVDTRENNKILSGTYGSKFTIDHVEGIVLQENIAKPLLHKMVSFALVIIQLLPFVIIPLIVITIVTWKNKSSSVSNQTT